jgi:soluble cytochrome b562
MIIGVSPVTDRGGAMNLHMILVIAFVLSVTGCAEKEQVMSEPGDEAPMTAPEDVAPTAENEIWRNDSFREHMHLHAEKLDDLNYALADGNLEAAMTPAHWLSTHDTDTDVQSDWLPYLYGMRTEAEAVETAPDLATARAAAERINAQCQTCHAAVGISTQ